MLKKDSYLLEEAYLSISKKTPVVPSDKEMITTNPNKLVSTGPMDEPAPGVSMNMINSEVEDMDSKDKDTTGIPVTMVASEMEEEHHECSCGSEDCDCEEVHEMALDNLNSIRESIMKIASHCASGKHLEAWAHQKLAIAMDSLAGIARSIR